MEAVRRFVGTGIATSNFMNVVTCRKDTRGKTFCFPSGSLQIKAKERMSEKRACLFSDGIMGSFDGSGGAGWLRGKGVVLPEGHRSFLAEKASMHPGMTIPGKFKLEV